MVLLDIAITAVLVPFMEEFAFRGVVLSALRKYGIGFSIVASALIFGMAHMDFSTVVFAFVAGLVFGFLYAKTNNLWLPVIIHSLNNLIAVLGSHGEFLFGDMAYFVNNLLMLVPLGVGLVALVLLLVFKRGMFISVPVPPVRRPRPAFGRGGERGVHCAGAHVLGGGGPDGPVHPQPVFRAMMPAPCLFAGKAVYARALELAQEAAAAGEVPVGAVVVKRAASSARAATAGRRAKPLWPTPSWRPSTRPAKPWAPGASPAATCTHLGALPHVHGCHYQRPRG